MRGTNTVFADGGKTVKRALIQQKSFYFLSGKNIERPVSNSFRIFFQIILSLFEPVVVGIYAVCAISVISTHAIHVVYSKMFDGPL